MMIWSFLLLWPMASFILSAQSVSQSVLHTSSLAAASSRISHPYKSAADSGIPSCTISIAYYDDVYSSDYWSKALETVQVAIDTPIPSMGLVAGDLCNLALDQYDSMGDLTRAIQNGKVNVLLLNSIFMTCVVERYPITLINGFVRNAFGHNFTGSSGVILSRRSSAIKQLSHLTNPRIVSGPASSGPLHLYQRRMLSEAGFNIFTDATEVVYTNHLDMIANGVLSGDFDIAFFNPKILPCYVDINDINILGPTSTLSYESVISEPQEYAGYNLGVLIRDTFQLGEMISQTLARQPFGLSSSSIRSVTPAINDCDTFKTSAIGGWTYPSSLTQTSFLERNFSIFQNSQKSTCDVSVDDMTYDYIVCPSGTVKLSQDDVTRNCDKINVDCPMDAYCSCSPCYRAYPFILGTISPNLFWIYSAVAAFFAILSSWIVQSTVLYSDLILKIPEQHITVTSPVQIVGQNKFGHIIVGELKSLTPSASRPQRDANRLVLLQKLTVRSRIMDEHASNEGIAISMPANFVRDENSKATSSTQRRTFESEMEAAPRPRRRSQSSQFHKFERCMTAITQYISRSLRIQLGERLGEDARRRVVSVARIYHPNIVKTLGLVSDRGQFILVTEYPEAGTLADLMTNPSTPLDVDVVLRIIRDVALGMQTIHNEFPPILHTVTTHNVWLDANSTAKILLADNFNSPSKNIHEDIRNFGLLMKECMEQALKQESKEFIANKNASGVKVTSNPALEELAKSAKTIVEQTKTGRKRASMSNLIELLSQLQNDEHRRAQTRRRSEFTRNRQQDTLLKSIMPESFIQALRNSQPPQPESHYVSIIFTDVVNSTQISAGLTPLQSFQMLDRLYKQFDAEAKIHRVYKQETIGDGYMGVCNFREEQPDHAARLLRFAVVLIRIASRTPIQLANRNDCLTIRVGIHSGPVIVNIAGSLTSNPRCCLFGDTVNVAARMESTSEPAKIQISQTSASLVENQDQSLAKFVKPRTHKPHIKGKGHMSTFWFDYPSLTEDYPDLSIEINRREQE